MYILKMHNFTHCQLTEKNVPWTDLVWVNWQSSWTPGWEWKSCRCYLFLSVWGAAAGAPDGFPALQKPQNDCILGSEEPRPTCDSVRTRNRAARSLSAHMTRQTPNEQIERKIKYFSRIPFCMIYHFKIISNYTHVFGPFLLTTFLFIHLYIHYCLKFF